MSRRVNGVTIPDDVKERGYDTYSRKLWMTDAEWNIYCNARWNLPFGDRLYIAQGPWQVMNGGGASASKGYHDGADAVDYSVVALNDREIKELVYYHRSEVGGTAYERGPDLPGHMVRHVHADYHLKGGYRPSGLDWAWNDYINGGNGLVPPSHGPDYERRPPEPLRLRPTRKAIMGLQDDISAIVSKEIEKLPKLLLATPNRVIDGEPIPLGAQLAQTHYRAGRGRDFARQALDSLVAQGKITAADADQALAGLPADDAE